MATNLIVRNVDEEVVQSLKEQEPRDPKALTLADLTEADLVVAVKEAEHRAILKAALLQPRKRSFNEVLASMPNVGLDSDFERNRG